MGYLSLICPPVSPSETTNDQRPSLPRCLRPNLAGGPVPRPSDWRAPLYSPQPIVLAPTRTDFGTEETIPGKDPETAPTPPQNGKPLDKSAATPELIPIPR